MNRAARNLLQKPMVHRYYLLNKPTGCVSACKDAQDPTVLDLFPQEEREGLFPIGRLDKYTEGVLLITDDGKLNHRLLSPENHVEKRYLLWAYGVLTPEKVAALEGGIELHGLPGITRPAHVKQIAISTVRELSVPIFPIRRELAEQQPDAPAFCIELTLTEGKRHQVKRMLKEVDALVLWLRRTSFAGITLEEDLLPGQYRPLTEDEKKSLGVV